MRTLIQTLYEEREPLISESDELVWMVLERSTCYYYDGKRCRAPKDIICKYRGPGSKCYLYGGS